MKGRYNEDMILGLGRAIDMMAQSVGRGSGTLVFFSSYSVLNHCKMVWKKKQFRFAKAFRYEDRNPRKMAKVFERHVEDCNGRADADGAILGGVFRARLSEGIDFRDDQARLVIIVGVPLPNITDPYIIIKRELKSLKNSPDPEWLDKMAMRAVN